MAKQDPRHTAFVKEYFYGESRGNAEKCAIIAGYTPGYAKSHSWSFVGEYRTDSMSKHLWDMVQAEREKIGEKWGITEQRVMDGYIRDEEFDPIHLVDPETGLPETDLRNIPKHIRMSLKGLKVRQQLLKSDDKTQLIKQTSEFLYPDKKGNRDSMAKIMGMMKDKMEHTGKDGAPIEIVKSFLDDIAGSQAVDELPNLTQKKL